MIRAILVDDEPLAREGLRVALGSEPDIKIVGEAEDGPSAVKRIRELSPDLVFLDVQMPGLDGFQVLESLTNVPSVIFLTAYDQYAVRAFEADALDYLLKPIALSRLHQALERARAHIAVERQTPAVKTEVPEAARGPHPEHLQRIPVRDGDRIFMLRVDEIDWVESASNYIAVHARGRSFLLRVRMNDMAVKLDPDRFARVHRSIIVNLDRIQEIRPASHGDFTVVLNDGTAVPMSRTHHKNLLKW
jgi:two-component system, LytTR family, response regulator